MSKKIFALASFFAKSLFKQKATTLFVVLALVMFAIALAVSDIDIARRFKLLEDVLLTSQMFLLHIAGLFYGFELLQKDKNGGIFVLPLSTALRRSCYMASLFLALSIMVLWLFLAFFLVDALLLYAIEGELAMLVLWQLFLFALSAVLLAFLALLFSQFVSIMNATIYAVSLFLLGSGLDELYLYAHGVLKEPGLLKPLSEILFYILPNFSLFDLQGIVVNRASFDSWRLFLFPPLYFVALVGVLFVITVIKYNKRVLKVGE